MLEKRRKFQNVLCIITVLAIALFTLWQVKLATPYGMGLYNDSVQYIFGARNLTAGNGYMRISGGGELKPITTVPPLFSAAISIVSLIGLEALRAARFLILSLLGLDIILWGWLVWRVSRSRLFCLFGVILFASSSIVLSAFTKLMSEPLFIFLWLLCFLIYDQYLSSRRTIWLIILGAACGLAYLTRYIGIAFFTTFALSLLIFEAGWKKKVSSLFWTGVAFLPFMAGWSIRNQILIGNPVNRTIMYHPVTVEYVSFAINSFWDWVIPNAINDLLQLYAVPLRVTFLVLFVLGLVVLTIFLIAYSKNRIWDKQPHLNFEQVILLLTLGLHPVVYLILNIVAVSFVDASTLLDHRLLLPVYFSLWLLILAGLSALYQRSGTIIRVIMLILIVASLGASVMEGNQVMIEGKNDDGFGYAALSLQFSPSTIYIQSLPPTIFYTNKYFMFYIITDRNAYQSPPMIDSVSREPREDFLSGLATMKSAILAGDALLVYYREPGYQTDKYYLALTDGLTVIEEFPDAIIFGKGE